jgi:hypothetical protein
MSNFCIDLPPLCSCGHNHSNSELEQLILKKFDQIQVFIDTLLTLKLQWMAETSSSHSTKPIFFSIYKNVDELAHKTKIVVPTEAMISPFLQFFHNTGLSHCLLPDSYPGPATNGIVFCLIVITSTNKMRCEPRVMYRHAVC